ncbi:23S rRNA pseudouridine(2605) synthase RluB [Glaciecola sp. 1036]|uniref:23S rRNA pseudouridine(2605) synthase RluB n=1 Tax=Alteromonadaceae TaxID=72275 RepID=UPI003CFE4F4B
MSEKLQKILANNGVGSRREMEKWIEQGRVSVNGKVATLGDRAEETDQIRVDGHLISRQKEKSPCRVLMYNKPEGVICSAKDPEGRPTVFDRLPPLVGQRWIAIGRLDINTSGLLLFTNDGELANRLMHPSYEIEREYAVRIFGEVTPAILRNLAKGVELEDGLAKFDSVKVKPNEEEAVNHWYNVTLKEGRNREVRRLWESQGVKVSRLIRIRFGNIEMFKRLPQGTWLEMDLEHVNQLRQMAKLSNETETKVHTMEQLDHTKLSRMRRSLRKTKQNKMVGQRHRNNSRKK